MKESHTGRSRLLTKIEQNQPTTSSILFKKIITLQKSAAQTAYFYFPYPSSNYLGRGMVARGAQLHPMQ
jgi:hypothetical protein